MAALNALLNHAGVTMLFYLPNGNPVTREALCYGAAAAAMFAAVILWFQCCNVVMTAEKYLYVFGSALPGVSLLLSMAAALLALFLCIGLLEPLAAFFRDAIAVSKLSGVYTGPLLKCMTISILTMIGESLCKDAGQAAGACAVQLVGVAAALYAALPLMRTFLTMIGECL